MLGVLANILYINSNEDDENEDEDKDKDWLNILTNNTSVCLKDKENGAKLTLSISGNTLSPKLKNARVLSYSLKFL